METERKQRGRPRKIKPEKIFKPRGRPVGIKTERDLYKVSYYDTKTDQWVTIDKTFSTYKEILPIIRPFNIAFTEDILTKIRLNKCKKWSKYIKIVKICN